MHIIKVCMGGACQRAFSGTVLQKAENILKIQAGESTTDGKIRLEKCGCLSRCEEAPNVFFGESSSPLDLWMQNGKIETRCFPQKIETKIAALQNETSSHS